MIFLQIASNARHASKRGVLMLPACFALFLLMEFPNQNLSLQFKTGQTNVFLIEQESVITDTLGANTSVVKNRTSVKKEWKVIEVDNGQVATMEMRVLQLNVETTRPNGEIFKYSSASPEGPLKESLSPLVGPVVAKIKVDSLGRVIQVIEAKFGNASRFEAEPPFGAILHSQIPSKGQQWTRDYQLILEPPAGTGEKIAMHQKYVINDIAGSLVSISVQTNSAKPFANGLEESALAQMMPSGVVVFDLHKKVTVRTEMTIDREIANTAGPGSKCHFKASYRETLQDK